MQLGHQSTPKVKNLTVEEPNAGCQGSVQSRRAREGALFHFTPLPVYCYLDQLASSPRPRIAPSPIPPHVLARRYPRSYDDCSDTVHQDTNTAHTLSHGNTCRINTTAHSLPHLSPTHQNHRNYHHYYHHHCRSLTRNLAPILLSLLFLAGFVFVTLGWPLSHSFVHISSVLHCSISSP